MRTLVTGASGFLGTELVARNHEFLGVDLKSLNPRVIVCDVRNQAEFQRIVLENRIERIVHLAGIQHSQYIRRSRRTTHFLGNIEMAYSVSEVAVRTGVKKVVFVSTDMVYGDKVLGPVEESQLPFPLGEYGESKLEAERLLGSNSKEYELAILRPRLILGAGRAGTVKKLAKMIQYPVPLLLIGNGSNKYQFVGVEDVCSAIELCLKNGVRGVFNVGSDDSPNLNFLFDSVLRSLDVKKVRIRIPSRFAILLFNFLDLIGCSPLAPEQYKIAGVDFVLCTCKIKRELGWKATRDDETMLFQSLQAQIQR